MSTLYTYSIANDTFNGLVDVYGLIQEIQDSAIEQPVETVFTNDGDVLTVQFPSALDAGDKTSLDNLVANHSGDPVTVESILASFVLVQAEKSVTAGVGSYDILGGVVAKPSFFGKVANQFVRVEIMVKVDDGGGGEKPTIRIVDDDAGSLTVLTSTPVEIDDTAGVWTPVVIDGDVAPVGDTVEHEFRIEGSLNGATSFDVRHGTFSFMETS